jgi:hypothetical protein
MYIHLLEAGFNIEFYFLFSKNEDIGKYLALISRCWTPTWTD